MGLKSVILTGGGEPLLYPWIDDLVRWISSMKLHIGLITNGTRSGNLKGWDLLSWVRVSLNDFPGWRERIHVPDGPYKLGASVVYSDGLDVSEFVSKAEELGCSYLRILPDCTLEDIDLEHSRISRAIQKVDSQIIFHQMKRKRKPSASICHQAFFRPYLCEDGYVYPCDSLPLDGDMMFNPKYRICRIERVGDFMEGRIKMDVNPSRDCDHCVFTDNVDAIDRWANGDDERFV